MSFLKFLFRLFVGVMIGWVGVGIYGGQQAQQLLVMLVICTFGISLIVLVPLAYLIGLACTFWFLPVGSSREKKTLEVMAMKSPLAKSSQWVALVDFVGKSLKHGRSQQSLRQECLEAGWSEELIQAAFKAVQTPEGYTY